MTGRARSAGPLWLMVGETSVPTLVWSYPLLVTLSPNIVCLRGHGATGAHTICRYSGFTWRIDVIGFYIRVIIIIALWLFLFEVHLLTRRVRLRVLLRVPPGVLPLGRATLLFLD